MQSENSLSILEGPQHRRMYGICKGVRARVLTARSCLSQRALGKLHDDSYVRRHRIRRTEELILLIPTAQDR
jgi:hypothetical protein